MSFPTTVYSSIERLSNTLGTEDFYEARFDNDVNGNPIYAGWSPIINAGTSEKVWFIKKLHYDANQAVERVQMPDDGVKFSYDWDSRVSLFS